MWPDIPDTPFLTVDQVAEALKVSDGTIRRWVREGLLPGIQIANRVRIPRQELIEALEQARIQPSQATD
ncbi:MAG: helix-turn-helix domain-containing protein [Chloroflexi bacterium]|nr:helix-turn-helix domain-containing protein [Chloroflexota bacterium]MBU1749662.1 helix-turn-helix domain-containing protein [Chloroflexota bacterium]